MYPSFSSQHFPNLRLCEIQRKQQVYVPPLPVYYEDLSRLTTRGKDTDTQELIKFIYQKMADEGILYTLVNRLYQMRSNDIQFYVPQLVYIGIKLNCRPILKFLIDSSQTSLRLFCLIYWNVQAFGFQMKDKSIQIRQRLDTYEKDMVKAMVGSPHDIEMFGDQKPKIGFDMIKTIRRQHCQYFLRFINKLVKTSIDLKKIDEGIRKQRLKEEITKANQSLKMWAAKYKQYKIKTHTGITIPFRRERYQNFSSTLVVGIIENQCSCFNTKKRVPYRIVLQTVDLEDFDKYQTRGSLSRKPQSLVNTIDSFLQDIPEVDYIPPIEIIKTDNDQDKFKALGTLITQTIKNEQQANNSNLNLGLRPETQNSKVSQPGGLVNSLARKNTFRKSRPANLVGTPNFYIREAKSQIIEQDPQQIFDQENYLKNLQQFQSFFPKKDATIKRTQSLNASERLANRAKTALLTKTTRNLFKFNGKNQRSPVRFSQRIIKGSQRTQFIQHLGKNVKNKAIIKRLESMNKNQSPNVDQRDLQNLWVQEITGIRKFGPWEQLWHDKVKRFKINSIYSTFPSYKLRNVIVKGGDDLRQEIVCMQVITKIRDIFVNAGLHLYLRPYQIIVTSESSGILEFVTNGISIDELKKKNAENFISLFNFYEEMYQSKLYEAQKRFAESLAAYSILTYILQIKDRHNGNILIDYEGHIVHIDFGFIFSISPGNWNFQSSPFKLTNEYVELLEGEDSDLYAYFRQLFYQGFNQLKKHVDEICTIVDIMSRDSDLPCFQQFNMTVFRQRFKANYDDDKMKQYCEGLIFQSCRNWRTVQYDYFQYLTNQIAQ